MWRRILFILSFTGMLALPLLGQEAGQIVGSVTDSSGAVVPGVTVKAIESTQTGFVRTTVTAGATGGTCCPPPPDSIRNNGRIPWIPQVPPQWNRTAGQPEPDANITLEVGAVTETVQCGAAVRWTLPLDAQRSGGSRAHRRVAAERARRARLTTLVPGRSSAVSTETASRYRAGCDCHRTGRMLARSLSGWTASATPISTSRKTRPFRSRTPCRSSPSRRAIIARPRGTTPARS